MESAATGAMWFWALSGLLSGAFIAHAAPLLRKDQLGIAWAYARPIERLAIVALAAALGPSVMILEWRMLAVMVGRRAKLMRLRFLSGLAASAKACLHRGMDQGQHIAFRARYWDHVRRKQGYDAMNWLERDRLEQAFLWITGEERLPSEEEIAAATMATAVVRRPLPLTRTVAAAACAIGIIYAYWKI